MYTALDWWPVSLCNEEETAVSNCNSLHMKCHYANDHIATVSCLPAQELIFVGF